MASLRRVVLRLVNVFRCARTFGWLDDLLRDGRYALHQFRRSPGFTAVAVTMLAVGIGVNTTVFTVTNAVLFKASPSVDRNDRIVYVGTGQSCCVSYPDFEDWRAQAKSFEGMGAVADLRITLSDRSGLTEASGATQVTANAFKLIGRQPIIGRDFAPPDEVPGAAPVAILSDAFWEGRYMRDPTTAPSASILSLLWDTNKAAGCRVHQSRSQLPYRP